jgi:hypothetical protein
MPSTTTCTSMLAALIEDNPSFVEGDKVDRRGSRWAAALGTWSQGPVLDSPPQVMPGSAGNATLRVRYRFGKVQQGSIFHGSSK